jgi:rhodanese-related sulfurtransferase
MGSLADLQEDLSPEQVQEAVCEGRAQLVDVRESYEYEAGRIAGARHIELVRLADEAHTLRGDRPVVFYCRTGSRSAVATQAFRASGLDAYNLAGGLIAWAERGLPIDPPGGRVADH